MKINTQILDVDPKEVLSDTDYYELSLNINANIKSILREISLWSKKLEDLDSGQKRWFKHLSEYNATIENLEGYYISCYKIYAKREINSEVITDCDQPEFDLEPEKLPFQITNEEVVVLLTEDYLGAYLEGRELTPQDSDPRIIKVRSKGNVPLCKHCKGTGIKICSSCNGKGSVTCSCCGGTGLNPQTHREIVSKDTYWVDGTLHERNSYSERRTQCPVCQGSGIEICENCGGQKSFPCDACDGTGKKDGAKSAATVNKLYESYQIENDSSIIFNNNDRISFTYPEKIQNQDSIIYFSKPETISKLECDDCDDKYLTDYLKDIIKSSFVKEKNQYLVGFAIEIKKIPEGLVKKITITYNDNACEFYITSDKFHMDLGFVPTISFIEELSKKYKKKI